MIAIWYRWHRRLGLLALLPVLVWSLSGLTHPLMAVAYKPKVARTTLAAPPLADTSAWLPLQTVLEQAQIPQFNNARHVQFGGQSYYQVQTGAESDPLGNGSIRYFNVLTGSELPDGDLLYAEHLARSFLGDASAQITSRDKLDGFTSTYVLINRLLPVYQIRFDRGDGIELFVHTFSDRLGSTNDWWRRGNLWIFNQGHTFAFLGPRDSWFRLTVVISFAVLAMIVGLSGLSLYGLLFRKLQAAKAGNALRKWHRLGGLAVSMSLLGFAATGAWMASGDYEPDNLQFKVVREVFQPRDLPHDPVQLASAQKLGIVNFGIVKIGGQLHYQYLLPGWAERGEIVYVQPTSGETLAQGDRVFAQELAGKLTGWAKFPVKETQLVTQFSNRYPAVFKRLPVQKVVFAGPGLFACHVETTTGQLSQSVTGPQLARTIAFLNLHKYHFLDGLGPVARESVMSLASIAIAAVALLGFALYLRPYWNKRRTPESPGERGA